MVAAATGLRPQTNDSCGRVTETPFASELEEGRDPARLVEDEEALSHHEEALSRHEEALSRNHTGRLPTTD